MCRFSTQITGKHASASAPNNHCDSGPASIPQYLQQCIGLARNLNLPNNLARASLRRG
jgi:hypothetical protein